MRKIFFVVLCLCAWDTAVYAATPCGEIEEGCEAGQYCTETGGPDSQPYCKSCPEGFSHSDDGSDDIKDCYKICGEEDGWPDSEDFNTENGRLELNGDEEIIHYFSEDQEYLCLYNLVCNDEHDKCDGYHLAVDERSCQPNKQECTGENGRGIQVWNWNEGKYSDCYITSCNEGCGLGPTASGLELPQICEQEYGACECEGDFSDACQRWLSGCNGQILSNGKTEWDYGNGWWDFRNCYCKTEDVDVDGGKGTTTCFYESSNKYGGNTKWSTDCGVIVSSCNSGYCVQGVDFSKCVPAPFGYYAAANDLVCQACPDVGTTTERVGAESAAACVMVRGVGGTRFCDSQGCFYLPGTGFIQKAN